MEQSTVISCQIDTTNPLTPLGFKILLDGAEIYSSDHVSSAVDFNHSLNDDDEANHTLQFVMYGKTQEHTLVDDQGNITEDARILIKNIKFDDIDLGMMFVKKAEYGHDFNGSQTPVVDKFYGEMGCNGTVNFQFSTPIYLWLLENM